MNLDATTASEKDSKEVVRICTVYAQKGMWNIFIVVFCFALALPFFNPYFFIGYLIGIAFFGLFQAIFMANAGGAWDNAKKIVEVELRQKGTDLHAATVVGDTVGDPFKDTSSVAMNPVIKFTTLFGCSPLKSRSRCRTKTRRRHRRVFFTPHLAQCLFTDAFPPTIRRFGSAAQFQKLGPARCGLPFFRAKCARICSGAGFQPRRPPRSSPRDAPVPPSLKSCDYRTRSTQDSTWSRAIGVVAALTAAYSPLATPVPSVWFSPPGSAVASDLSHLWRRFVSETPQQKVSATPDAGSASCCLIVGFLRRQSWRCITRFGIARTGKNSVFRASATVLPSASARDSLPVTTDRLRRTTLDRRRQPRSALSSSASAMNPSSSRTPIPRGIFRRSPPALATCYWLSAPDSSRAGALPRPARRALENSLHSTSPKSARPTLLLSRAAAGVS